jgi:hypothetical protein
LAAASSAAAAAAATTSAAAPLAASAALSLSTVARSLAARLSLRPVRAIAAAVGPAGGFQARSASSVGAQGSRGDALSAVSRLTSLADVEDLVRAYGDKTAKPKIALVKIGGEVLQNELDELVKNVRFLRNSGLVPVVVHGAGPQLNAEIAKLGVEHEGDPISGALCSLNGREGRRQFARATGGDALA